MVLDVNKLRQDVLDGWSFNCAMGKQGIRESTKLYFALREKHPEVAEIYKIYADRRSLDRKGIKARGVHLSERAGLKS